MRHCDTEIGGVPGIVGLPLGKHYRKSGRTGRGTGMLVGFEPFEVTAGATRDSVSLTLLSHDGFLGDPIREFLGEMRVVQVRSHETEDTFEADLRLFLRKSRAPLGEVHLSVEKDAVSPAMLRAFRKAEGHPGDVFAAEGEKVSLGAPRFLRDRFGRRARRCVVDGASGERLAVLFEAFVPDLELLDLLDVPKAG